MTSQPLNVYSVWYSMGAQCNGLTVYARNTEITLIAMYKDTIGSGSMDLVVNCNNLSTNLEPAYRCFHKTTFG